MTITNPTNSAIFLGNGATTVFDFTFVAVAAADLAVTYTDPAGNATVLAPADVTIVLNAIQPGAAWALGGTVTYPLIGAPIPPGSSLKIARTLPVTQGTSVSNQTALYLQVIERALDYLTMLVQQIYGLIGSFVGSPPNNPNVVDFTGRRGINAADPVAAQDVGTKHYIDVGDANTLSAAETFATAEIDAWITQGPAVAAGSWNASTNTPALASGVGIVGRAYLVAVAGSTALDGNAGWQIGDWALFALDSKWHRIPAYTGFSPIAVTTLAALRTVTGTVANQSVRMLGTLAAGDGLDDEFWWNAASTAADDGLTCIQPNSVGTGRWISALFARRSHPGQFSNWLAPIAAKVAAGLPALVRLVGDSQSALPYSATQGLIGKLKAVFGDAGNLTTFLGDLGQTIATTLPGKTPNTSSAATAASGWLQQSFSGLGLRRASIPNTATAQSFQSPIPCTEIRLYYSVEAAGGTLAWTIDGVAQTAINCAGSQALGQEIIVTGLDYTGHTVAFGTPAGGNAYLERLKWCNNRAGVDIEDSCLGNTALFDYMQVRPISGGFYLPFGLFVAPIATVGTNGLDAIIGNNGAARPDAFYLAFGGNEVHGLIPGYGSQYRVLTGGTINWATGFAYLVNTARSLNGASGAGTGLPILYFQYPGGYERHPNIQATTEGANWNLIRGLVQTYFGSLPQAHGALIDGEAMFDPSSIVEYANHFDANPANYTSTAPGDVTTSSTGASWWIHLSRASHQLVLAEMVQRLGLSKFGAPAYEGAASFVNAVSPGIQMPVTFPGTGLWLAPNTLEMLLVDGRYRKCYRESDAGLTIGGQLRQLRRSDDGIENWDGTGDVYGVQSGGPPGTTAGTDAYGKYFNPNTGAGGADGDGPPYAHTLDVNNSTAIVATYKTPFGTLDGKPFTVCMVVSGMGAAWVSGFNGANFGTALRLYVDGVDTGIDTTSDSGVTLNRDGVVYFDVDKPTVVFITAADLAGASGNGWLQVYIQSGGTTGGVTLAKFYGLWITKTSFPVRPGVTISQQRYPGPKLTMAPSVDPPGGDLIFGQRYSETVNGHTVEKRCIGIDTVKLNDTTQWYGLYECLNESAITYIWLPSPDGHGATTYAAEYGGDVAAIALSSGGTNFTYTSPFAAYAPGNIYTIASRLWLPASNFSQATLAIAINDAGGNQYWLQTNGTWATGFAVLDVIGPNSVQVGRPWAATITLPDPLPAGFGSSFFIIVQLTMAATGSTTAHLGPLVIADGSSALA